MAATLKRTLSSERTHLAEAGQSYFRTEILNTDWNNTNTIIFRQHSDPSSSSSRILPDIRSSLTDASLNICADHLRSGGLVAFPTETVYGLGANALNPDAIRKIYAAKRRPADNPLIVHVSDIAMLRDLLPSQGNSNKSQQDAPTSEPEGTNTAWLGHPVYQTLVRHFWPGALTLLFNVSATATEGNNTPARKFVPSEVTCGQPTLAVRMPSHPLARALIARTGLPLAAPSANASGRPSPTTAAHVYRDLGGQQDGANQSQSPTGRIQYILDGGPCTVGVESTVVDGVTAPGELRVLRPGGVTVEQLASCLRTHDLLLETSEPSNDASSKKGPVRLRVYGKDMARSTEAETNPTTPGMKYRHYSPTAPVALVITKRRDEPLEKVLQSKLPSAAPALSDQTGTSIVDLIRQQVEIASASSAPTTEDSTPSTSAPRTATVGLMSLSDSGLFEAACGTDKVASSKIQHWLDTESETPPMGPIIDLNSASKVKVRLQPFSIGTQARLDLAARRLFDGLRTLDEAGCDCILVEALADDGIGLAVMNRLAKAASQSFLVDHPRPAAI
ncbi:hypothetical protein OC846_004005 [Tilletia horrida]|uniref:Threonylcarbamoyl-AMP synthase n=1 Tax=Tilletia horrida TaxID=155126 RepID=A0AAN6GP30_9BASI|nr:hypothetical protein OC846_004005 [Tilletia horrida]KAK0564245.1 hypothetical protein OC861_004393 [Tilletia horrida]